MTTKRALMFAVLAIVVGAAVATSPAQQKEGARPEAKYEYRTVQLSASAGPVEIDKALNELGAAGWEVTTSTAVDRTNRPGVLNYTFKRAKR